MIRMCMMIACLCFIYSAKVEATKSTTIYNAKGYKVLLHTPDSAKNYYHLHFYKSGKHVYCLRLDNFKYCDGKNGKDKIPNWLREKVMADSRVQKAVKHHNPGVTDSKVFKRILKVGAVSLTAILVVLAAFNVFAGPADDVAAWAAFLKALAW